MHATSLDKTTSLLSQHISFIWQVCDTSLAISDNTTPTTPTPTIYPPLRIYPYCIYMQHKCRAIKGAAGCHLQPVFPLHLSLGQLQRSANVGWPCFFFFFFKTEADD